MYLHPTADYSFLIDIDPARAPRYVQNLRFDETICAKKGRYANAIALSQESEVPLMPDFDPVQMFYSDLKVRDELLMCHFGTASRLLHCR